MGQVSDRASAHSTPGSSSHQIRISWKDACRRALKRLFTEELKDSWYHEVLAVIGTWQDGVEEPFARPLRWTLFLELSSDSELLKYQAWKRESTGGPKALFEVLGEDLSDVRSPAGALISTFRTVYSTSNHERVQSIADDKKREEAAFLLAQSVSIVLRFAYVLKTTLQSFYHPLSLLLEEKTKETEAMLLTHIVQGDLFLLLERLTNIVYLELGKNEGEKVGSEARGALENMKKLWLHFVACESICEKLAMLEMLKNEVPNEARFTELVQTSARTIPTVLSHLRLTKLLSTEPHPALESCLSAIYKPTSP